MTDSEGAASDVASEVEDLAHKAVALAGKGVNVPLEAAGGIANGVARTLRALADFVDELAN